MTKTEIAENVSCEEMAQLLQLIEQNNSMLWCDRYDDHCHRGKQYRTFSESPAACWSALLCENVSAPPLELSNLNLDFSQVVEESNAFEIEPQKCCYGQHVKFTTTASSTTTRYQKCGWDGTFRGMPLHPWSEEDEDFQTNDIVTHKINACPDDIKRQDEVV